MTTHAFPSIARSIGAGVRRCAALVPVCLLVMADVIGATERPVPVETVKAVRSDSVTRQFRLTGTVTARRRSSLSARTEGLVMKLEVDAGSRVREGDVLLSLDTRLAEINLEAVRAEIEGARIRLEDAGRQVDEVRQLAETGGFAKSQAESLKAALKVAEARFKQLQVRETEQLELIRRHDLVAPFDGVISRKLTEAGEWVTHGKPVLELVETENLRFDLQVPQESLVALQQADRVRVFLDVDPARSFEAAISVIVPVKDKVSRTFLTRLELRNPDGTAAPGMSGTAEIRFRPLGGDSVQVPRDAVVRLPDGSARVWVVKPDGDSHRVESRVVRTAGSLGDLSEILEGLEGDESVVLRGNEGLRENQPVTPQAAAAAPGKRSTTH